MKRILLALALLPLLSLPVLAEDTGHPPAMISSGGTQIIADDRTDTIHFIINGEEKAFLDADGLHVQENIHYGGTIKDYGTEGFDTHVKGQDKEAESNE